MLFVNLRGFHPDPAQPPADPAAVLDGFLRLLGVPGQQIPHDLPEPAPPPTATGSPAPAPWSCWTTPPTAEQVRPLLPGDPGLPHPGHQPAQPHRPARQRPIWPWTCSPPDEAVGLPDPGRARRSGRRGSGRGRPDRPPLRLPAAGARPGRRAHPRHARLDADRPRRPARRTPPPPAPGHRRRTRPRPVLPAPARRPAAAAAAARAAPRPGLRRLRRRRPGRHRPGRRRRTAWTTCAATTCCSRPRRAGTPSTTWSAPTPPAGPTTRTARPTAAPR